MVGIAKKKNKINKKIYKYKKNKKDEKDKKWENLSKIPTKILFNKIKNAMQ